jgi:ketosteroid isomerase-like protein
MELAHVITMRDGRAVRTVEFMDRTEALEAAGCGSGRRLDRRP